MSTLLQNRKAHSNSTHHRCEACTVEQQWSPGTDSRVVGPTPPNSSMVETRQRQLQTVFVTVGTTKFEALIR